MAEARAEARRTLNRAPGRELAQFSGILTAVDVDERGRAVDKKGKRVPTSARRTYYLQDGLVFDAKGNVIEDEKAIPKEVREWREEAKANRPTAGLTHPGSEISCPVPGCRYMTCSETNFVGHMHCHEMDSAGRTEITRNAIAKRPRVNPGDFLDPRGVMAAQQGHAGPGGTVAAEA
ncbi:MAG: hypothetical protein JSW71_10215 [Gemmatimonadota bacterium]|nr:MAG: hypothetical protein JSW71_10215 [Gemmatimonadota bacterium]